MLLPVQGMLKRQVNPGFAPTLSDLCNLDLYLLALGWRLLC